MDHGRLSPTLRIGWNVCRKQPLQTAAFALCVVFGLALIANTQTAAEGDWFWYSSFFREGKRLYADLHLALQPLFVLETSAFMAVVGKGWLASKIPAVLHLVADCVAILLLVRKSNLSDARKAIVLACTFFVSISFEAYQFNDYHVLADCFVLYSLVALLSLNVSSSRRRTLSLAAILGVLSGMTLTTRLNDGAALFVGVFLATLCLAPSKRLLALLLYCLTTALAVVFVVFLTGDSLHDYAMYSIFKSAGSKGGATGVLARPLELPGNTIQWLIHNWPSQTLTYALVLAVIAAFLIRPLRKSKPHIRGLAAIGIVLIAVAAYQRGLFKSIALLTSLAALTVLLAYLICIVVAVRFIFWLSRPNRASEWDKREILLLIPLGQMASGAMSSGGTHLGLYAPAAFFIVLLTICSPIHVKADWAHDSFLALAVILIVCTASIRFQDPCSWLVYRAKPMFADRTWYRHPDYGPMVIEKDLLQMIQPVCENLRDRGSDDELLSLPFPYANYFCSIPPWHGYVQTFFDTSSKQEVEGLINELRHSPPKWIFYQRQLKVLRLHEVAYNRGNALPHRYLDQFIEQKISQGIWRVIYVSDFGNSQEWDNKWILIETR